MMIQMIQSEKLNRAIYNVGIRKIIKVLCRAIGPI